MSDNNRLEFDIVATQHTDDATAKVKANFRSQEEQAAKTASNINRSFESQAVGISAQYEKATASAMRSLDALELRAALAGKSIRDKLIIQRDSGVKRFGADEDAIQRHVNAMNKLIDVEDRAERKRETRTAGISAGKATVSGEADFQAALRAVQSRDAEIKLLEQRAQRATLSKPDFLRSELGGLLSQRGVTDSAAQRYRAAYADLIKAAEEEEKHSGGHGSGSSMVLRRGFLGLKDAWEGRTQGTVIEAADILMGTSGGGGILPGVVSSLGEMTGLGSTAVIAIGSVAAAFGGLQLAGLGAMKSLAEYGQEVQNIHLRTGIAAENVEQFAFAAKMGGQDVGVFEKMMRGLSEAENDNSSSGTKARAEMSRLGISLRDATGQVKPTEQVLVELSTALGKIPPGAQRDAAAMEIFKRVGIEAIPVISGLADNVKKAKDIGLGATKEDLDRWEEYHRKITEAGAMWDNFVRRIKGVLAATVIIAFEDSSGKTLHPDDLRKMGVNPRYAGSDSSGLSAQTQVDRSVFPGATNGGIDLKGISGYADQVAAYNRKKADFAKFEQSPEQQLGVAEDQLRAIGKPSVDNMPEYRAAFDRVQRLKAADKASKDNAQDLVAAGKEGQQLLAQSADIKESAMLKQFSVDDGRKGLVSESEFASMMEAAKQKAIADENKFINDHRNANGSVSAQFLDAANANLPQRIENEQAQVQSKFDDREALYFREQRNAIFDGPGKERQAREESARNAASDIDRLTTASRERSYDIAASEIDREKNLAIQSLGIVNAQSVQEKQQLEDRKFAIESFYAQKSTALQIQRLETERNIQLNEIGARAARDPQNQYIYDQESQQVRLNADQQIASARQGLEDKLQLSSIDTVNKKAQFEIESNKRVYDSLKHDAEGLFDQLAFHTKSWGAFAKEIVKAAVLTPVKEIFSSQVAALGTKGLTGQDVTFGEVGNGQGTFGKFGSIFGRAGLGQPKFGDANHPLAKLAAPNHLGDVSLVSGAVPVVILNSAQVGQAHVQQAKQSSGLGSLAAGLGLVSLFSGGSVSATTQSVRAPIESVTSQLLGGAIDGTSGADQLLNIASGSGNLSDSIFTKAFAQSLSAAPVQGGGVLSRLGGLFGMGGSDGVKGTPPFLPNDGWVQNTGNGFSGLLNRFFGGGWSHNGILGGMNPDGSMNATGGSSGGGILGNLGSMFGLKSSGTDLGNGVGIANTGILGHLAAFGKSGGAALLGGSIALDGIRRGGALGTLEAAGGGAAVGFKYGGVLGAGIGAAIGGGLALAKTFGLFDGDRKHAKDLVQQVYGLKINDATADQIIAIAKQSFGSQIDVAVRSPQVRDLLRLYAQAHGDKKAEDKFVQDSVHSASFSESGGKLLQNAVYDNGNAYAYASSLPTYGGVTTAPLSTYQPNQGVFSGNLSINLNGQSAADVLEGRVTNVVTPGFVQGQALSASSSSNGRTAQQNMTLSPSALTR